MSTRNFSASLANSIRPLIDWGCGCFTHNGCKVRVAMRRGRISVGCTDITIEAARQLLAEYDKRFSESEMVVQEGDTL